MSATKKEAEAVKIEPQQAAQPAGSPRKRRRRAPTTGAADDCFACQERQTKCDRRRPYCTPCLDQGKDCSGYKTQLTWGVGVASRGKLRGLSLPIPKSKRAAQSMDEEDDKKTNGPKKLAKLGPTRRATDSLNNAQLRSPTSAPTTGSTVTSTTYNFVNMDPNSSASTTSPSPMLPPPSFEWRAPSSLFQGRDSQQVRKRPRRHTLQPLSVPTMHPTRDYGVMPMTASVIGGYGHHDFGLSSQISPMVPSFTGYGIVSPTYKDFTSSSMVPSSCEDNFFTSHETLGWPRDNLSSSLGPNHSNQDYRQQDTFYADLMATANPTDSMLPTQQTFPPHDLGVTSASDTSSLTAGSKYPVYASHSSALVADDVGDHPSSVVPRLLPSLAIGNTPKLQYLIDYYDKVISPVIVAFDGPTNPYRSHILSLAVESETLQHAIAALSASNLRMRRGHNPLSTNRSSQSISSSSHDYSVRKSSIAHSLMDVGIDRLPETSASEPSHDELYHKGASIKALNEQLADPLRRKDDSILATLLILCLYHICDTGVAKFKTQFAGVKKILALRGGTKGDNSKATNWLTIMFTWFDAMTASVNDRESQLDGDDLDMSTVNGDEWALENLAGCDGRLFKLIAKLGRLNLLSQNKPVAGSSTRSSPNAKAQQLPSPVMKNQDYYSMNYNRFDGNGWSVMVEEEPAEADTRAQFWKEWSEIREKLQNWQLDGPMTPPPEGDRRDIYHISESFRYSALLYTERLAYPHLPSAHPNFQSLVTEALFHISNVQSDVFLLWPLFITGTECVSEQGRYLIRERCLDIQKDSGFFNNISGLELLEKIWRDDETNDEQPPRLTASGLPMVSNEFSTMGGHGFRWRKAMERVDGEYIVV
ncbi:MAG: hypothetical protein ALECFALPRED_004566 [Alectoria fallacina]|uniref:Zn(2)-C6 fungal-type domain-containing protein n=1 Tax=Alectoria fallacina TaxID=1903189 RepID=A0A8H3FSE8_9LECA|nr:MAG: hypothetical protein ALECFALPRED_004566 [Alectoria fallacina]